MKDLPEGTKVRVLCNKTSHRFNTHQIVIREKDEYDFAYQNSAAFVSECGEEKWYMAPDEYEIMSYPEVCKSDADKIKELEAKVKELEKIIEGYRSFAVNVLKAV